MSLSPAEVAKVGLLARLSLSPAERDAMARELSSIVGFVSQLGELDVSGVEPLAHPLETRNVFRSDVVHECLSTAEALQSAPRHDGECFLVPAVLGETGSA